MIRPRRDTGALPAPLASITLAQQPRQLGNVGGDPPRFVAGEATARCSEHLDQIGDLTTHRLYCFPGTVGLGGRAGRFGRVNLARRSPSMSFRLATIR
jgi:hypothetical protein